MVNFDKIIDESDKAILREVVGCHIHGFFRAGFILCWTAIVESLRRKIQDLSDSGEPSAAEGWRKIELSEKNKQSVDKQVIETSKDLAIVSELQYDQLKVQWGKRSMFVHPYEQKPEKFELEFLIQFGFDLTFSKPTLFKRKSVENFLNTIETHRHFLSTDPGQAIPRINSFLARVEIKQFPFLFKTLLYNIGLEIKKSLWGKTDEFKKYRLVCLALISQSDFNISLPEMGAERLVTEHPKSFIWGVVSESTWQLIPTELQIELFRFLSSNMGIDHLNDGLLDLFHSSLIPKNLLSPEQEGIYCDLLDDVYFDSANPLYPLHRRLSRMQKDLDVYDFGIQNPVFEFLSSESSGMLLKGAPRRDLFQVGKLWYKKYLKGNINAKRLFINRKESRSPELIWMDLGFFFSNLIPENEGVLDISPQLMINTISQACDYFAPTEIKMLLRLWRRALEGSELSYFMNKRKDEFEKEFENLDSSIFPQDLFEESKTKFYSLFD